jgi:hypothetical protein
MREFFNELLVLSNLTGSLQEIDKRNDFRLTSKRSSSLILSAIKLYAKFGCHVIVPFSDVIASKGSLALVPIQTDNLHSGYSKDYR